MIAQGKKSKTYINTCKHILNEVASGAYWLEIGIGFLLLCILAGSIYGYHVWSNMRLRNAQKTLAECVKEFYKAQKGIVTWSDVSQLCSYGLKEQRGTELDVYFLSLQAQAYLQQKEYNKALELFDEAIQSCSRANSVKPLVETKKALAMLDWGDETEKQAALVILERVAKMATQYGADEAAYQLGNYYWLHNDVAAAQQAWKLLDEYKGTDARGMSPYKALADAKLKQVS